jgi:DNA-binding CsgD family transcriptional regulator/tetratricopeptide (TPR) repeat protein
VDLANDDRERERIYNEQSLAIARTIGDTTSIARALNNLANLARLHGQYDRARELIEESMAVSHKAGNMDTFALALGVVALIALETGDLDRAAEVFQERLRLYWSLGDSWGIQRTLHFLTTTAIARDQPAEAVRLLAAVAALQEKTGIVSGPPDRPHLESVERLRSKLIETLGEASFQSDWEKARTISLTDTVVETLNADMRAAAATAARSPDVTPTHPLSPRELDVLRGIIAGQSNQEIAAALFISPNTVSNHVANIMNKLGVDSRTAVATWAVRNGVG